MDLTKLSDSDLESLSKNNISAMSDDGLRMLAESKKAPSFAKKALGALEMVSRGIDAVTGAPVRAGIYAAEEGKNPIKAGLTQFGDSRNAPTGKMIAMKAGIRDEEFSPTVKFISNMSLPALLTNLLPKEYQEKLSHMTKADVAGAAIDIVADPTNLLPFGKPIVKGASVASSFLADALKGSYLGEKAGKALGAAGKGASKVGEMVSGVPAQDISVYAKKAPEIRKLVREAGGSIPEAADTVREGYQTAIQSTKKEANKAIETAISKAPTKKTVDITPVIDQLSQVRGRLNPNLEKESISQIDEMIDRLEDVANLRGKASPKDIVAITKFLQGKGQRSFLNGQIFQAGSDAQLAAKNASLTAKKLRNKSVSGIDEPFSVLRDLRVTQKTMNKNLIAPGKPDAALMAAGSRTNERSREALQNLSRITGSDMVGEAEKLSAARTFTNPSFSPYDYTGKSVYRIGAGAALGAGAAHVVGVNPKVGAIIGAAMTSPAALKLAIDTGRLPIELAQKLAGTAKKLDNADYVKAFATLKTAEGGTIVQNYISQINENRTDEGEMWQPLFKAPPNERSSAIKRKLQR